MKLTSITRLRDLAMVLRYSYNDTIYISSTAAESFANELNDDLMCMECEENDRF